MDQFSYLSVLLSIILGLAITQVLKGFRGILLARKRVVIYWPVLVWAVLLLAIYVQSWWASFGMRSISQWTFPEFSVVLLQSVILYMLGALVFPDFFGDEPTDLRAHYYQHTGWFFGLMIAALVTSLLKDVVLSGHFTDAVNVSFHLFFIASSAIAMFTRREGYHKGMSVFGLLLFGVYTLLLFSRLR
jgi:hypothetical protein